MSIKALVLLSLIAAAAASPAPAPAPEPTLGLVKGILGLGGRGGERVGGLDFGVGIKALFGSLIGHKHVARNNLNDILNLRLENFGDFCNLLARVTVSMCDTVEASITGLGELLSRVIFFFLRCVICFLGGAGNDNPICRSDINLLVGVQASAAADARGLISLYGLGDCKARLNTMINLYTRGRGIAGCRGSVRVILNLALSLINRIQIVIDRSGRLSKADLSFCIKKIACLMGAVGNSRQRGLGLQIVQRFLPLCNKYIVKAGYPGITDWKDVELEINLGNDDRAPWAVPDFDASADTGVTLSIGGLIGNLFKGLIGVKRLASNLIQDIFNIVFRSVEDVFTLALKIVLGLGGLLDSTIAGLGSLLVRIVAGLLKIVLCFLGTGSRYGVCQPGWERQVGVRGSATSAELVLRLYGLRGCRGRVNRYIDTYTRGKGLKSTNGSIRILLQSCVTLADIVESRKWDKSIVVIVFRHITYLLGAVGNSNSKGVGTSVCNKFIPACNKYLTAAGYPGFGDDQNKIIQIVEDANSDDISWSADIGSDDDDKTTGFIDDNSNDSDNSSNDNDNDDNKGNTSVTTGGSGGVVGNLFRIIFGTVSGVSRLAVTALNTIVSIKFRAFNDVFTLITNLTVVLQVTLNNLVAGLGSFFARLVACSVKIAVCVKGYPGDHGVCTPGWNSRFGITGDASSAADLVTLFRLGNAQTELDTYIRKRTNGKGIKAARPAVRLIFEKITTLTLFIKNYKQFSKQTFTDTFVIMTTVSASVGNSRKRDSGKQIIQYIIPQCGVLFKQQGYPDISAQIDVIKKDCDNANDDNVNWNGGDSGATTPSGGDKGDSTPSGGDKGDSTPSGGDKGDSTPSGGDKGDSTPSGGDKGDSTPSGGDKGDSIPSGGDKGDSTPSGGDKGDSTPSGGDKGDSTPSGGDKGDSTPSGGDKGDSTPSGGDKGDSTPSGGDKGDSTPSGGNKGDSTPSGGDKGDSTPSGGDKGDSTPSGGDKGDSTPSGGDKGDSTPSGGDKGDSTPSGGDKGDSTPSGGDKGDSTPSGGDKGDSTPSGADKGDSTPSGGDKGDSTPSGGDKGDSTPSGGDKGDSTPSGGDKGDSTPSGGDKGDSTPSGGDKGDSTPSGGDKGDSTPSGGDKGDSTPSGDTGNDKDCGKDIGTVIQVIPGVTRLSSTIIKELISIKINTFYDLINLTCKLTLALGGIIDSIISGLGSIMSRMVAVMIKIMFCVGYKGQDSGNICTKEWNAQWGVVGEASAAADLLALFRVNNCKSDVNSIINTYTKGKGVSGTSGFTKVILQTATYISSLTTTTITTETFSTIFVQVINVFGSVTNSYKKGSGSVVIRKVLPVCGAWFVRRRLPDVRRQQTVIISTVTQADADNFDWTQVNAGGNTKSDKMATKVKQVFKDVKQSGAGADKPSLTAALNLQPPRSFDDVCSFGVQVVLALGSVIDAFIQGLGTLIVRVVGCLIKYIVAVLGAARNNKSFVSQKAYYSTFGVTVSGTSWAALSSGFQITNAKANLDSILNKYTNNKGRGSLKGAEKVVFDCAFSLVDISSKGQAVQESALTAVFYSVTTMLTGFANSLTAGVGDTICDNMLPTVSYYLEQNGYPSLGSQSKSIYATIKTCSGVRAPWSSSGSAAVQRDD